MDDASAGRRLSIALLGTRGVPARYGGFETAAEEIGQRLVEAGHAVTVYCRRGNASDDRQVEHLGMRLVTLPGIKQRSLDTLSHSAVAVAHAVGRGRFDAVIVFNSANAVLLPALRLRRLPVAVHVDGLEWKRAKWTGLAKRYYRRAEALAVRWADALIADAPGIARYYADEFGASTELLAYGAPILRDLPDDRLAALGLTRHGYHLVVARFEPENHLEEIVLGYRTSAAAHPLVVVGSAPYSDAYTQRVHQAAAGDPRVQFVGAVWDQDLLDQLFAHALLYLHGHSVGGTNPALLRAMGAGAPVSAFDVSFNRDVLGDAAHVFTDPASVAAAVEAAEADPAASEAAGDANRTRAEAEYRWSEVAAGYEHLVRRLAGGGSRRGECTGRRRPAKSAR